jgi:hypothetical protein
VEARRVRGELPADLGEARSATADLDRAPPRPPVHPGRLVDSHRPNYLKCDRTVEDYRPSQSVLMELTSNVAAGGAMNSTTNTKPGIYR